MTAFAENTYFEVEHCCECGIAFGMPADFQRRRRNDHEWFYCPAGHKQHYTGPTEAQKMKQELERKSEMLIAAERRAETAETERRQITKAHHKMRERVMNGVCPCCNRSFENLRRHMQTEHADFGTVRTLLALRQAFCMTQADVGREAGVKVFYVSMYERDKPVARYAKQRLDDWIARHDQTIDERATDTEGEKG